MKSSYFRHLIIALLPLIFLAIPISAGAQAPSAASFTEKAIAALRAGDPGNALVYLQHALVNDPENLDLQYGLGVAYQRLGRIDEAESIFQALVRQDEERFGKGFFELARIAADRGKNRDALAFLAKAEAAYPARAGYEAGLIYLKEKDYAGAAESFRKSRSAGGEFTVPATIYEAVALGYLKKIDEARKLVESVLRMSLRPEQAELARKALAWIEAEGRGEKRWHIAGVSGFQYDSNIFASPLESPGAPGQPTNKDDFAQLNSVTGRYDFFRQDALSIGAGYNHYNLTYFEHPDMSITAARPSLYAFYNNAPVFAGLEYVYAHYWTGADPSADVNGIYPIFSIGTGDTWRTEVRGWAEWRDLHNNSPDEQFYGYGFTEYYLMRGGLAHIRAGVNFNFDETNPFRAGSYNDTQFTAGVQFPVWQDKWFLDISGWAIQRNYRFNPQVSSDATREDKEQDLYVVLRGPVAPNLQLYFIFQQVWNDSNISQPAQVGTVDSFNFQRTIFSCLLAYEF